MSQMFILPKSVLNYNGRQIRVNFWEWVAIGLSEEQAAIFDQEIAEFDEHLISLASAGTYIDMPVEELPNGDLCQAFVFTESLENMPQSDGNLVREKWEAIFAADPNVEYAGSMYVYLRDV
jgi:hypothetical protein